MMAIIFRLGRHVLEQLFKLVEAPHLWIELDKFMDLT